MAYGGQRGASAAFDFGGAGPIRFEQIGITGTSLLLRRLLTSENWAFITVGITRLLKYHPSGQNSSDVTHLRPYCCIRVQGASGGKWLIMRETLLDDACDRGRNHLTQGQLYS